MRLSNKKLTTEEKIEKSKKIHEEIERRKKSLNERIDDLKKLDAEIADELEKAYIVNMQELGKHTVGKIGEGFSLEQYIEIVDCIFTLDEVTDYVNSEREKLSRKADDEGTAEIEPAEEVAYSDAGSGSA